MGLVNTATGEYQPPPPPSRSQGNLVAPQRLPQRQPNAYAEVDVHDFGAASRLTAEEILTMASVAESRNDARAALQWKSYATARQLKDQTADGSATFQQMTTPKRPFAPGRILEGTAGLPPWEEDAEWKKAAGDVARLQESHAGVDPMVRDPGRVREQLAKAQARLSTLTDELSAKYVTSGLWSEQDANQSLARKSMAAKGAAVVAQVKKVNP